MSDERSPGPASADAALQRPARPAALRILRLLPEGDPVDHAATALGAEVIAATSSAEAMQAAQKLAPDVVIVHARPFAEWGGLAMASMVAQAAPGARLIVVGPDDPKLRIEALLAADSYLTTPLHPDVVRFALHTAFTKAGMTRTARYRKSRRVDVRSLQTAALHVLGRRLVAAGTIGEVAEILKGEIADILPFRAFGFLGAPEEERFHLRWYVAEPLAATMLEAAQQDLLSHIQAYFPSFNRTRCRTRVYGPVLAAGSASDGLLTDAALAEGTPPHRPPESPPAELRGITPCQAVEVWPLWNGAGRAAEAGATERSAVGLVALLSDEPLQVADPVRGLIDEMLELAASAVARIDRQRNEHVDLLRMMIDSLAEGRLWIDVRHHRVLANAAARHLLGLAPTGPVSRQEAQDALGKAGLVEVFFGPLGKGASRIEATGVLPGSGVPQRVQLHRIRKGLYTYGVLLTFRDA